MSRTAAAKVRASLRALQDDMNGSTLVVDRYGHTIDTWTRGTYAEPHADHRAYAVNREGLPSVEEIMKAWA